MKKILLLLAALLMVSSVIAVDEATIKYTTENGDHADKLSVVKNVPFVLHVWMKTTPATKSVKSVKLYTKSTNINLETNYYRPAAYWFQSLKPTTATGQVKSSKNLWLYQLPVTINVEKSAAYKKLVSIKATPKLVAGTVDVDSRALNAIGRTPAGSFTLKTTSLSIAPQTSKCGDGVIDTAAGEVCDEGFDSKKANNNLKKGGCASNCKSVDIGYSCANTGILKNLKSTCTKMTPEQLFLAKVTALINKKCYPNNNHPQAIYCTAKKHFITYTAGKMSKGSKIKFITNLATALVEFLKAKVS